MNEMPKQTSRSPVSYVMKPLTDYFSRAFRDS